MCRYVRSCSKATSDSLCFSNTPQFRINLIFLCYTCTFIHINLITGLESNLQWLSSWRTMPLKSYRQIGTMKMRRNATGHPTSSQKKLKLAVLSAAAPTKEFVPLSIRVLYRGKCISLSSLYFVL